MALSPGTRLGPYEITGALGAGGMGDVYRAKDTRLDRLVAVKVLRLDAADSGATRERFEREARAISRLSHPNVCALFDVGHSDDIEYLVMELLDGETLGARIAKGSLPISQLLQYGREMAIALAAAHRQGIVHRDLKPGNVMLTSSGVKLLDFGLAKSAEPVAAGSDPGDVRTAAPLTAQGTWLGTAPYMAPEQIEGRPADARSDVFALGAVLYEMATGHRAFAGDSPARIGSAILQVDPPMVSSLRPELPPLFGRLVGECLAKDPEARWQTAHDVALQLAAIDEQTRSTTRQPPAPRAGSGWLGWAAAVVIAIALVASLWSGRPAPAPPDRVELQILPPANGAFSYSVETIGFALSPDGSELAFIATQAGGPRRVWRRPLASIEATPIAGTDGAISTFWAPDGKSIAFFVGDTLKRLDLASGAAVPICKVPSGIGLFGTWSTDGQILFASIEGDAIYRVPTSGGTPTPVVKPDASRDETRLLFPSFLPDGRFLYLLRVRDGSGVLMLGEVDKPPRRITSVDSNAQYVDSGAVVFARGGTLVGQRFDLATGQVAGEPFAIAPSVRFFLSTGTATFAASRSGGLVYQSQSDRARLAWLDRDGRELETVSAAGQYLDVRLASTGRTVRFSRTLPSTGTFDIWSVDLDRKTETRVTLDDGFTEIGPVMPPGGQTMIFAEARGGPPRLMRRNLATNQDERVIPQGSRLQQPEDVSPDGRTLAYSERTDRGHFNLWTLPLSGPAKPSVLRESPFNEQDLRFSPDGRYYSFVSSESGRQEVYVSAVSGGAKTPVSNGGARRARWSRDGRELFYLTLDRRLVAVAVRTVPTLQLGTPATLFAIGSRPWPDYDASPDGKRFLAIIPEVVADEQPLTAIRNWSAPTPR